MTGKDDPLTGKDTPLKDGVPHRSALPSVDRKSVV